MSLFKRFGKKNKTKSKSKTNKETEKDNRSARVNAAIQTIKQQINTLEKSKIHTSKRIDALTNEAAIAARNKDKKTAMYKLKLRKNLSNRLEGIDNKLINLEIQIMTLDDLLSQANIMDAMKVANDTMKLYVNDDTIEQAEQIKEDLDEQMERQQDLAAIMNEPLTYGDPIDEDELNDQLRALEEEDMMNDPQSEHYIYKEKEKKKEKEQDQDMTGITGGLVDNKEDEVDMNMNMDMNIGDVDVDVGSVDAKKLSKEEKEMLKDMKKHENLLLNRGNDADDDMSSHDEYSDMDMTASEEEENEIKVIKLKNHEKKKQDVMIATSANMDRSSSSLISKIDNASSAMVLCF